jgi:hypothetical protein
MEMLGGILLALLLLGFFLGLRQLVRAVARRLRSLRRRRGPPRTARLRGWRLRGLRASARRADVRSAALAGEVERLRLQLRAVTQERDEALVALAEEGRASRRGRAADRRFDDAKRAFAMMFHPDRPGVPPHEKSLRQSMFKEFWVELRRIEKGK